MRTRVLAVSSDIDVAEAATSVLTKGNAVDAVVAGVFAAAALNPAVLLGPVQVLVGGAGAGLRAFDGRGRQPGFGIPRPRGFKADETIAPASRVAVPALPAALAAALASFGRSTFVQVLAPAIERARVSTERLKFLKRLAQHGPSVLAEHAVASELVAAAGRIAGGLLTEEDLSRVRPIAAPCAVHVLGDRRFGTTPWGATAVRDASDAAAVSGNVSQIIAVSDANGLVAIACYEAPGEGVAVPELGLVAPFGAAPVLRGEARVPPGDPRPAAAPIAMSELAGVLDVAVGIAHAEAAERSLAAILVALSQVASVLELRAAPPAQGGRTVGLVRNRDGASMLLV